MTDLNKKISLEELEKLSPDLVKEARGAIGLAESFPVKGGNIVPKKRGGWYEALRNTHLQTEQNT